MSSLINPYHELFCLLEGQSLELRLALRKKLIWAYSWAVPDAGAIAALVEQGPLVEIGAGSGYWSWLARQHSGNMIAYDKFERQPPRWTEVEQGLPKNVLKQHSDRALFLCWPPYQDEMASECLAAYEGGTVIYVGEFGGRTADERFHRSLEYDYSLAKEIAIPCWPGFSDKMYVFSKRTNAH